MAKSMDSCGSVCMKDKQKGYLNDFCLQTGRAFSFEKLRVGRYKERLSNSEYILSKQEFPSATD